MEIQDLISDIDRTIGFKQHRIKTAAATRNFKTYDEISQEISSLKAEYIAELGLLQKKAAKSSWYHKHKETKATSAGPSESDTPSMEVSVDEPESNSGRTLEGSGEILDLTGESEQDTELNADPESPFHPGLPAPK